MRRLRPIHAALLLAAIYLAVLWVTAPAVGYTRDEGYYFKAAEEYSRWFGVLFSSRFFEAFTDAEIMRHFSYNTEHPALIKLTQGLTHHLFSGLLGVASPATGFRITGFSFAALSMIATFLLGRELVSERAGLLAAVLLALQPRYFYDAHLACFDVPITAMWTLSLYTFHRALTAPEGKALSRSIVAGIVFGLALATKLNALFLPFIYVGLWLISPRRGRPGFVRAPSGGLDLRLPAVPVALIACAIIGPLVFIAHWPYLWHDTFARIGGYIAFHMRHEHYPISYFGELLVKPPFPISFPFVMTFFTVPAPVLALGTLGLGVSIVRTIRSRSLGDALLVIATLLPMVLIALPSTPIFGGVKHWYTALPALSILAARALFDASDWIKLRLAAPIAAGLAIAPGLLGTIDSHPNGIGFYNELAGGFRGGAELGMQRGFWGGLGFPLYSDLPKGRVFFNRTNYDCYRMYRREGILRSDISYANDAKYATAGVVFEQPEHAEKEGEVWSAIGTRPVDGVYQDNVTLIQLYVEGKSDRSPE